MLLAVCFLALKCASWKGLLQKNMQMIIQGYKALPYKITNNTGRILTTTLT